jgi:hypothetical protein
MREQLQAIDPAVLLNVVRQDQRDPNFVILDWTVDILSNKGSAYPEGLGLWCFRGHGQSSDGIKPWSVVLKILKDRGEVVEPSYLGYWKREYLARESGLLSRLPGHVAQARSYGTSEHADSIWLWMELISDTTGGSWSPDEYAFAARQLGRLNAVYVTGTAVPNYSWLATDHIETWTSFFPPDDVWTNALVQQSFSSQTRTRVMELWQEKESFLAILQRLPQAFSHFDYKRSNLFIRRITESDREVVAVDWNDCGVGPLGGDLTRLVGASTFFRDWDVSLLAELDAIAFAAYVGGLRDMGWPGDSNLVRLAYSIWFALDWGCTAPKFVALSTMDESRALFRRVLGCEPEETTAGFVALCEFALERAEEARQLMARLNLP